MNSLHEAVVLNVAWDELKFDDICIGNSMVSSAIWEKHARVSFSKTYKIARVRRTSSICVFEKLMSACFSQISRETILLLDNNLYIEMIETR